MAEKNKTFICELILERYKYLRNTQKRLKITKYGRHENFLEFYLVYNGICLKLLESLMYKLGDFASLNIKMGGGFCITTFDALSSFYFIFVNISYTVKMPLSYWLHSEVGSSPVFTLSKNIDISCEKVVIPNVYTL